MDDHSCVLKFEASLPEKMYIYAFFIPHFCVCDGMAEQKGKREAACPHHNKEKASFKNQHWREDLVGLPWNLKFNTKLVLGPVVFMKVRVAAKLSWSIATERWGWFIADVGIPQNLNYWADL